MPDSGEWPESPIDPNRIEVQRYPEWARVIRVYNLKGVHHQAGGVYAEIPIDQAESVAQRIISAAKARP